MRRGERTVPPLANAGGAGQVSPVPRRTGLCAPSLPLRAWAGWGWTRRLSSCVRGQGGARGAGLAWPVRRGGCTVPPLAYAGKVGRVGWAGIACTEGDWGRWARADVVAQTWGKGPHAPYLCAKGAAVVNAGDGVGEGRWPSSCVDVNGWGQEEWRAELGPATAYPSSLVHLFPFPPVTTATFTRKGGHTMKGGTRGHVPPFHVAPPPPCQRMEDCVPTPVPFGAGDACPAPRAPPYPHTREEGLCTHPSVQATPAQPHAPRPARVRKRTDGMFSPTPPTHARGGTARTAQSSSARATPAQPHVPRPTLPAFARGGTVCSPLCMGRASPVPPPPAYAKGGSARPPSPHGLRQPGVYAPRHTRTPPGMQEGRCAQPSPLCAGHATPALPGYTLRLRRGARKGEGCTHARTRRGYAVRGTMQPERKPQAEELCEGCPGGVEHIPGGGAAHERKGRHIGARVRKGECDSEGVVNEVERSQGEAARVNGGHPRQ
ncbi:hypothetical protein EDB83DRAFT_2637572 [Lactarius deliciosus]|nr:hypothetical protein EDB83DRAFT_2637572 [Lactarius deliciosus]